MKKRILSFVLVITSVLSIGLVNVTPGTVNAATMSGGSSQESGSYLKSSDYKKEIVALADIMSYGTGGSTKKVTRGQFSKMLTNASTFKNQKNTKKSSVYKDVTKKNTYASYINLAVTNKWMTGYSNGTFKPSDNIKLKDAAKAVIYLLGYGTKENGSPESVSGALAKFYELDLDKNIKKTKEQTLTGKDCMNLFYNLLNAKTSTNQIYCETLDYEVNSDSEIDFMNLLEDNLSSSYITGDKVSTKLPFKISSATVYRNETLSTAKQIKSYDIVYYNKDIKLVWAYSNQVTGKVEAITPNDRSPETVTIDGETFTLGNSKVKKVFMKSGTFEKGDTVSVILGLNDEIVDTDTLTGPNLASTNWKKSVPFKIDSARCYLNDKESTAANLDGIDLYYYSQKFMTVWGYDNHVSGTIDAISPNDRSPEQITIDGETFVLGSDEVKKTLSKSGSFKKGDSIAVLLGLNDEVVDTDFLTGPQLITESWKSQLPFDTKDAEFYLNDKTASEVNIKSNDILYYSPKTKTVWAYDNKVTGKLETISPNRRSPETITIDGEMFTLGNDTAKNAVSNKGTMDEGDYITIFLGKNDKVSVVMSEVDYGIDITGVIIETGSRTSTNVNDPYVISNYMVVTDTVGRNYTYDYAYNSTSNYREGEVVTVKYKDGKQDIIRSGNDVYRILGSKVNEAATEIGSYKLASDVKVVDIYQKKSHLINVKEIADLGLYDGNTKYMEINSLGEISGLILYNVTNTDDTYAVITDVITASNGFTDTRTYTYMTGGVTKTVSEDKMTGTAYEGAVCKIEELDDGELKFSLLSTDVVTEITTRKITTASWSKSVTGDLEVYYAASDNTYHKTTLEKVSNLENYRLAAYYEGGNVTTGQVRIIVAFSK